MTRPTELDVLMENAWSWSKRSTCSRLNVGAVIAMDGRIMSHGYNGAPAGLPHCVHDLGNEVGFGFARETSGCQEAVHAEANAIYYAARRGRATDGALLVCTHQPCRKCAEAIINAGICAVVYQEPYRKEDGLDLLVEAKIVVERYEKSP